MTAQGSRIEPIRYSTVAVVLRVIMALFLIETTYALLILMFLFFNFPGELHYPFIVSLWLLHTAKFFILVFILWRLLAWGLGRNAVIADHHLVLHSGLATEREQIYELSQLRSVVAHQGLLGRWLHFGDVRMVFTASGYSETLRLMDLHEPVYYENILESYLGEAIRPKVRSSPVQSPPMA